MLETVVMEMWNVEEGFFLERWDGMGKDVPSLRTAATRVEAKKATVERNFILNGLKALIDSVEEAVAVARRSETRGRGEKAGCDADDNSNISSPHDATYTFFSPSYPQISHLPSFGLVREPPSAKAPTTHLPTYPSPILPHPRDRIETERSNSPCVPTSRTPTPRRVHPLLLNNAQAHK